MCRSISNLGAKDKGENFEVCALSFLKTLYEFLQNSVGVFHLIILFKSQSKINSVNFSLSVKDPKFYAFFERPIIE